MWTLLIGISSGFLAGTLIKGRGFGCFGNLMVGILGSFLGNWLFRYLQIPVNENDKTLLLAMSTLGAIFLLALVSIFTKR
ncbi:GlsB/YeaQ/YmgE family stress response membrane protein [Apibacter sp. wkB309]|uniref:GlsB/YeaQ/YmgE family stress response membrane protein n=1 Tax=Apibacter sp. wkB309 TaxID=1679467 RepID=UPI000CF9FDC8|nr:GlsB/YeaQ/YmgE family stress response membrane protein [Apibacter sp. wkB309]PQL89995.1 GlsB/YeaQ/YmgE family stress response membrane protein [Apibacter sp. wkB309]